MTQGLFDFAEQSRPHREMVLRNSLRIHGLTAEVFKPVTFDNDYEEIYPENTETLTPVFTTQVLLTQPVAGFNLSASFISLADKVEEMVTVTCLDKLGLEYQLNVMFKDNRTMNLRIIESLTYHAQSTVGNQYKAVVT